jgi:hypothetical protein
VQNPEDYVSIEEPEDVVEKVIRDYEEEGLLMYAVLFTDGRRVMVRFRACNPNFSFSMPINSASTSRSSSDITLILTRPLTNAPSIARSLRSCLGSLHVLEVSNYFCSILLCLSRFLSLAGYISLLPHLTSYAFHTFTTPPNPHPTTCANFHEASF